jgi:hypothetical protein
LLCILYVTIVGLLVAVIGVLLERLLPATMARRWIWSAMLPASIILPAWYRAYHSVVVSGARGAPGVPTLVGLDAGLLARIGAIDVPIARTSAVVSVLLVIWAAANTGWISHRLRGSSAKRRWSGRSEVGGISVVVTESLGPATVGIWRPRVVLPRWVLALPDAQRRYVVRHEEEHRRSHDALLLCLASLCVVVIPWNLALWWQLRRLRLAVEIDCDKRVVSALGDPRSYGTLLLAVAQASNRGRRLQPAFLGGAGLLEQRLRVLLAPVTLPVVERLLWSVIVSVLFILVAAMPHPLAADHGHEHVQSRMTARLAMPR